MYQSSRFKFTDRSTWDTVLYRKKKTKQKNPWSRAYYTIRKILEAKLIILLVCVVHHSLFVWSADALLPEMWTFSAGAASLRVMHHSCLFCWCITRADALLPAASLTILSDASFLFLLMHYSSAVVVHHLPCGPVSEWCIILVCFDDALPELPDSLQCGASLAVWWCITTDFFLLRVMHHHTASDAVLKGESDALLRALHSLVKIPCIITSTQRNTERNSSIVTDAFG